MPNEKESLQVLLYECCKKLGELAKSLQKAVDAKANTSDDVLHGRSLVHLKECHTVMAKLVDKSDALYRDVETPAVDPQNLPAA